MPEEEFPDDLKRFLLDYINSVEQLEVLLLLRRDPAREWDAAAVGQTLYTQAESAAKRLSDLRALGLLAVAEGPPPRYRYLPDGEEKARLVDLLAQAYQERRVTVISLIYSKPHDNVQAFADAFRLRKDK